VIHTVPGVILMLDSERVKNIIPLNWYGNSHWML